MERSTRQRTAIRNLIEQAGRPLSPPEILEGARDAVPGIGLATVYRNIKSLLEAGLIQAVTLPGDGVRYEATTHHHHHHFQCLGCQRVFDVHACPGDLGRLAPPGFEVQGHELTLYGQCPDCRAAAQGRGAAG
ncbi:Fur family transcriptional regulator [Ideonella livida]|uniref:Ferric uptake regulation protein n=1 Tax=Ideonella livida TaxID=2707176 RepID=A0A7C9TJH2_9BURK|nr:Fur family transcriptional regulator [Ideonella livida]NDY91758.1 transcriptional repressor [Ideonella livida]